VLSADRLAPDGYDILDGLELCVYNPVGAGVSMSYSRHGRGGHKICTRQGIYAVTNNEGKWGWELRSTIFTPLAAIGVSCGGVGQSDYTLNLPQARVLHASADKAHTLGGYIGHTADHRPISETHSLGIITYRDGRWGSAGGVDVVLHHDYTNDLS
jgi:hypothetical protein